MLLNSKLAWLLPLFILKGEEHDLCTGRLLNTLNSSSLVLWAWAGNAVALTCAWPAALHDINLLARTNLAQLLNLSLDEGARILRRSVRVEERIQVRSHDIHYAAPS